MQDVGEDVRASCHDRGIWRLVERSPGDGEVHPSTPLGMLHCERLERYTPVVCELV